MKYMNEMESLLTGKVSSESIRASLALMTATQRRRVEKYLSGMTASQIAAEEGVSNKAVYKSLNGCAYTVQKKLNKLRNSLSING